MTESETPLTFEQSLARLEQLVQQLEDGRLGLHESLGCYEEGIKWLRECYRQLQAAERKIEVLAGVDAEGRPVCEPYDDTEASLEDRQGERSRRRSRTGSGAEPTPRPPRASGMDSEQRLF